MQYLSDGRRAGSSGGVKGDQVSVTSDGEQALDVSGGDLLDQFYLGTVT